MCKKDIPKNPYGPQYKPDYTKSKMAPQNSLSPKLVPQSGYCYLGSDRQKDGLKTELIGSIWFSFVQQLKFMRPKTQFVQITLKYFNVPELGIKQIQ